MEWREKRSKKFDEGKKLLQEFEQMIMLAQARALSKLSLERPLDDQEFKKYNDVMVKLGYK